MKKNIVKVCKIAVEIINELTEEAEKKDSGETRGDFFQMVDKLFDYPENTMAMYFGRLESSIIVRGKTKQKQKRDKKYARIKPRNERIWERRHGFGDLKKVVKKRV